MDLYEKPEVLPRKASYHGQSGKAPPLIPPEQGQLQDGVDRHGKVNHRSRLGPYPQLIWAAEEAAAAPEESNGGPLQMPAGRDDDGPPQAEADISCSVEPSNVSLDISFESDAQSNSPACARHPLATETANQAAAEAQQRLGGQCEQHPDDAAGSEASAFKAGPSPTDDSRDAPGDREGQGVRVEPSVAEAPNLPALKTSVPSGGSQAPLARRPPPSPTIKASETDLLVLAAEVQRLESELSEEQERRMAAEEELKGARASMEREARLQREQDVAKGVIAALRQDRAELEMQVSDLKKKLDQALTLARKEVRMEEMDAVRVRMERAERALESERKAKRRAEMLLQEARNHSQAEASAIEELAALKVQLRDTQTELDSAQASRDKEAANVQQLKQQLTLLLAASDVKLKEHEEMSREIARLRQITCHAEKEKGPMLEQLETAKIAMMAAESKASACDSTAMDLRAQCDALGATLGKLVDENAELAEVLNRKTAKEEMQARDREARDSLCAGDGHEDSTSDQETIGGSNGYRGAAGVDSLTETDMQLIVLAEEVARLEGDLQEDRAKLAAMAEAAAADEEELERLRSLVAETWKGGPKSGADAVIAAEEEEDRQHAASLEMHREISNLRAQLTDARARLFAAGIPAFPGPSTPVARYGTGSAVEAPEAPRITVEPECPVSEGGAETTGQPAAAPRDSTPDKAHGVSEIMAEGQSTEQPKEQNRSVGLWGFITGSDKKPE